MDVLKVEHLTKYYGKKPALIDLSLKLGEGEIFGFIGPNGAGKTTAIRAVMGLINRTSGTVSVLGQPFSKDSAALRERVGYLPGELNLYEEMTCADMIAYARRFRARTDKEKIRYLVKTLALEENKKVRELSMGNLKKLGIVLTLMHEPKLILMDEAANGLDPLMQQAFHEILRRERERGNSVFFSSHNLSEVSSLCDRVAIVREGRLLRADSVSALLSGDIHIVTLRCGDQTLCARLGEVLSSKDGTARFVYRGSCDALIAALSQTKIDRLLIEEPSLEQVFLKDFGREETHVNA